MGGTSRYYAAHSRVSRRHEEEEDLEGLIQDMHVETQNFLFKYFENCSLHQISMNRFIDKILVEYQNLWNSEQAEGI